MTPERIHFSRRGFLKGLMGAAGAGVLIGAGVKGAAPETPKPTPTGIPDRSPVVQTTPKAKTELQASPEQEKGVDFMTQNLVAQGTIENPGNRLVGLVTPEDGRTRVAVMDLDKVDLSSDTLLMEAIYQVPFIANKVAVDPQNPNRMLVTGFVRVDYSGHSVGMLAATSDGSNFTTVKGNQEMTYSPQIIGEWGFATEGSPWGVTLAKYSFSEGRIVDDIKITGLSSRYLLGDIAPLVSVQSGFEGIFSTGVYAGYAPFNINGSASGQFINTDQGIPRLLLFWPEGTDKMIGLMNNDTTAPGDERQELPTVYVDKNDILQYKFQPNLDFYSSLLPAGIAMTALNYNSSDRNFDTSIAVAKFQNVTRYFIEVVPQDDPNNMAKRKLIIPTIGGQQITSLPTSYGINSIHNRYDTNGEQWLLLGGSFGLAIAKMPPLTDKTTTVEFQPVKLKLQSPPRLFLPLTMGQQ